MEEPHPEDGRAKLIALSKEEKQQLLQMLLKLHRFHKPVFEEADMAFVDSKLGID